MTTNSYYQEGYTSWVDAWIRTGAPPAPRDAPSSYYGTGSKRQPFLHGWVQAQKDFLGEDHPGIDKNMKGKICANCGYYWSQHRAKDSACLSPQSDDYRRRPTYSTDRVFREFIS